MKKWIPEEGDIYKWGEHCVRRKGTIIKGIVISYDPVKKIVRGRCGLGKIGPTERRHLNDVELLEKKK